MTKKSTVKRQVNVYALFMRQATTFMRRLRLIDYTFSRNCEYGSSTSMA